MRKILFGLIATIIVSILLSCGEGSQKAKELLELILKLVGIPQHLVVNICQDSNENGICENFEVHGKIDIYSGDTVNTILEKIIQTEDGKYLLETANRDKPILLILEDSDTIQYDNGQITLNYGGFKQKEKEKELSILTAMIDAGHLQDEDIVKVKEMTDIDRFYGILLKDLEINYNTLREKELAPHRAMARNIEEMARELIENNVSEEFPKNVNECADESCRNRLLDDMSEQLLIDNEEANNIVQSENDIYNNSNNDPYRDSANSNPYSSNEDNNPYSSNSNRDPYRSDENNNPYSSDRNPPTEDNNNPYVDNENHDPYASDTNSDPYSNDENRNPYN